MASKSKNSTKSTKSTKSTQQVNAANLPPTGKTQKDVTPVVKSEPELSFEERTQVGQPWLTKSGKQRNK